MGRESEKQGQTAGAGKPDVTLDIIARIHTDFPEKFGIPRQAGLVNGLKGTIVFEPEYRNPDALRGLEGYDYLWLIWGFQNAEHGPESKRDSKADMDAANSKRDAQGNSDGTGERPDFKCKPAKTWSPTVRPPRLGGNERKGVFATRSPFRPNPLGLSSVRMEAIEQTKNGPVIRVAGVDMRDGTPIYDIKPYLPHVDSHPEARGGFAALVRDDCLTVDFPEELLERIPTEKRDALIEVLRQDPRPHYQKDAERIYGFGFDRFEIRFRVDGTRLTVVSCDDKADSKR